MAHKAESIAMLEATSEYLRDAFEQIASALGLAIEADYGPKPNGVLLDDILRQIGGCKGDAK